MRKLTIITFVLLAACHQTDINSLTPPEGYSFICSGGTLYIKNDKNGFLSSYIDKETMKPFRCYQKDHENGYYVITLGEQIAK